MIVLDEVQTLPPHLLSPILDVLSQLRDQYGCSLVLATATPPALARASHRAVGLSEVREIVADISDLARALTRVRVHWPASNSDVMTWDRLAERLTSHEQVLAVVHLRDDARVLAARLPAEGRFHLSARTCPAHRSAVLARVRDTLAAGKRCRLISTQLIEAGVDIDLRTR